MTIAKSVSAETQLAWIEPNSDPPHSPKGAKTDWILLVPADRGGGEITVTVGWNGGSPDGIALELRGERCGRARPKRVVVRDRKTVWTWAAPAELQLWRLVIKSEPAFAISGPFVIVQQVDAVSNGQRIVLSIDSPHYQSKSVRLVPHGAAAGSIRPRADGRVEYVPGDPRDYFVTRFLPLRSGAYELRLHLPSRDDLARVRVRAQVRDSSWLAMPTPAIADSHDGVVHTASFEIRGAGKDVRLHIHTEAPAVLPRVELVRLGETPAAAVALAETAVEPAAVARAFTESVLRLAAVPDEPRLGVVVASATEAMIDRAVSGDPWLHNYVKNAWEFVHQRTTLTTYPPDICVPIADVCNARCTFCTSWLEGSRLATLEQIDGFEQVFRFSRWVGLAGHGEPLAHPRIREILSRLTAWLDPRAEGYVITNGVYLGGLLDELITSRIRSFAISLNAASPAMHREVMGLPDGSFQTILSAVERVVALRGSHGCRVSVSMVITKQNIAEVPALIQLANELAIDKIQLKTLAPAGGTIEGLNYQTLPPYDHPDYPRLKANAVAAIAGSGVPVQVDCDSWDVPVFPAAFTAQIRTAPLRLVSRDEALSSRSLREMYHALPKYQEKTTGRVLADVNDFDGLNPLVRAAPFACRAPYRHLYINDFSFNLSPCCYMGTVPGAEPVMYDGAGSFMDAWNSPALVTLRRRLRDGPLFNMCTKCPGTY